MIFRTLMDGTPAEAYCRERIVADLASARLSRGFRAYYRLRPFLPIALRQSLQRRRNERLVAGRDWFVPTDFLDGLRELLADLDVAALQPWPHDARFALVLTHDVETAEGMRRIPKIAEIEQNLGLRSSWNLVPHKYPIDMGLVRDLQQRGFEIGVHGYNHDGRLFWSRRTFERRMPAISRAVTQYRAAGFRAPMVHRNLDWIERLPIDYDASCFDVDPYQAMPGGVGQMWPFLAGRMVELPYTLPQDHTLFVSLGLSDDAVWRRKLEVIERWSAMALLLTHPDYLETPRLQHLYRDFIEYAASRAGVWHALPCEVAAWWRQRATTDVAPSPSLNQPSAHGSRPING